MLCGYTYYGTFPTSTNHIATSSVEFYHPCHISSHIWEKEGLHQWAIYRSTSRHVDSPVFDFRTTLLYMSLNFAPDFDCIFSLPLYSLQPLLDIDALQPEAEVGVYTLPNHLRWSLLQSNDFPSSQSVLVEAIILHFLSELLKSLRLSGRVSAAWPSFAAL